MHIIPKYTTIKLAFRSTYSMSVIGTLLTTYIQGAYHMIGVDEASSYLLLFLLVGFASVRRPACSAK